MPGSSVILGVEGHHGRVLRHLAPQTRVGKIFTVVYIFAGLSIILGFIETVAKETLGRGRRRRQYRSDEGQGEDLGAS
jgi:Ion channel